MTKRPTREPRLTVELVPKTCWGRNLRRVIAKEEWNNLRKILDAFSGQCTICGNGDWNSPLHLHEVWSYDVEHKIQKLVKLQPICSACHDAKHWGRAAKVGLGEAALQHLATVNNWPLEIALRYIEREMEKHSELSQFTYDLDVSLVNRYLPYKPKIHMEWLTDKDKTARTKYDSISWARRILKSDALILDTETTGLLQSSRAEIVQVAVINTSGTLLCNQLVKPKYKIPKRATAIHGLTNETLANSPCFDAVYGELSALLSGRTIVSYNAKFDEGILAQTCTLYKSPRIDCKWECAMIAYRDYADSPSNLRLPNASHNAFEDCKATLDLITGMAKATASIPL